MEGRPAFVVPLVHVGSVLHQELHHVKIFINTGLQRKAHPVTQQITLSSATCHGLLQARTIQPFQAHASSQFSHKCPEDDF